jgi:DNA-binding NarL/FixJ family response regulator
MHFESPQEANINVSHGPVTKCCYTLQLQLSAHLEERSKGLSGLHNNMAPTRPLQMEVVMKILLMEPKVAARTLLREMARDLAANAEVFEASDRESATHVIANHRDLDLIVAEFRMACATGLLTTRNGEHVAAPRRLVVTSAMPSHPELWAAVTNGAMAYVPETESRSIMLAAMQIVIGGGRYFPPDLLVGRGPSDYETQSNLRYNLTSRQAEVLAHMAAGKSNKTIARELGMSAGTVKVHVTAILKALNVSNRTEAVVSAHGGAARRPHQNTQRRALPAHAARDLRISRPTSD